jgi:hypothetical protein
MHWLKGNSNINCKLYHKNRYIYRIKQQNIRIQSENNMYSVALCNTKTSVHISREVPQVKVQVLSPRSRVTVLLRPSNVVASKASGNWAIYHNICILYISTKRNYGSRNQLQRQLNCVVFNISSGQNEKQPTNDCTTNEDTIKIQHTIITINFKFEKCEL